MKRFAAIACTLVLLPLLLSACSVSSLIPSSTLVSGTPTPRPTAIPTDVPIAGGQAGYDTGAGNCTEAANEAIALIGDAAAGKFGGGSTFNVDMRIDLQPTNAQSQCDADKVHFPNFREHVTSASLTVWSLDSTWVYAGTVIRQQWLADVLNMLVARYPDANVTISVISAYNGGAPCGSASIGTGNGGQRTLDPSC